MLRSLFLVGLVFPAALFSAPVTIQIAPDLQHQQLTGFGTCLISWGDFPEIYDGAFAETYATTMGCNMLRVELSGTALPELVPDPNDIRHTDFFLDGSTGKARIFLDFAKALHSINPKIKIIGTVWTPPPWMKVGNQLGDPDLQEDRRSGSIRGDSYFVESIKKETSNRVKREFYPHFVAWLVEFAKRFKAQGTPLYAISPGNEVMFTQWFQSCVWTPSDYAEIVALLGEALENAGMGDILIFGPETMTSAQYAGANPAYLLALRSNPAAWRQMDVFASHGYVDGFITDISRNSSAQFRGLIEGYDKPYWMTEGGTGGHTWPEPLSGIAAAIHHSLVSGNASAFIPWQISESEANEHGLMVNRDLTKKSNAARHWFSMIAPNSVRIDCKSLDETIKSSAFLDPATQRITVVLINPETSTQSVQINLPLTSNKITRTVLTDLTRDFEATEIFIHIANGFTGVLPAQSLVSVQFDAR